MDLRTERPPIVYLLDQAPLFGGVKVVLDQANLLVEAGYKVTVRCTASAPDWMEVACHWQVLEDLGAPEPNASGDTADNANAAVVIGTYWTTLEPALRLAATGRALHYCQGYEASYSHNLDEHPAIRRAYALPLSVLSVSQHLADLVHREYGRQAQVVRQPLPRGFWPRPNHPAPSQQAGRTPRVLVMSPFEIDWKGVATALEALVMLRDRGEEFELVRLSQFEQGSQEKSYGLSGEFHHHLRPEHVPELVRSCDLLLAPSWEAEGFGLPVLEAMASGVPVIASDIGCFRIWTGEAARLVEPRDVPLWADTVELVLRDPATWERLRSRGLLVAEQYSAENSLASIEHAISRLVP